MIFGKMDDNILTLKKTRNLFEKLLRFARLSDSVRLKREWNHLNLRELPPETVLEGTQLLCVKNFWSGRKRLRSGR